MSDSVWPHRRQPTRLPSPGDSPGKNTGVDCHFLLQCMKVKSEREVAQSCPTLSDPMDCSPPSSSAHEVFQARVLEWGAITFQKLLSHYKSQCNVSMGTYTILIWERWEKIYVCVNMGSWFSRIATFFPKIFLLFFYIPNIYWALIPYNLEKAMAIHSSTLAWKTSWTEEPDRLQSMGSQRVGHNWATLLHYSL